MCKVCRAARGVGEIIRKPILGKYFPAAYTFRPAFRGLRIRSFRPPHISRYTPLYLMSSLAADGYKKTNPNPLSYKSGFGFCCCGDPWRNRTAVTAVKGPCLNLLTNGPYEYKVSLKQQAPYRPLLQPAQVF